MVVTSGCSGDRQLLINTQPLWTLMTRESAARGAIDDPIHVVVLVALFLCRVRTTVDHLAGGVRQPSPGTADPDPGVAGYVYQRRSCAPGYRRR